MPRFTVARIVVFASLALLACGGSAARGQGYDFTFSLGYSDLQLQNNNSLLYDHSGPYFDADFAFHVPQTRLPLTVGFGITGSGYFDSQDETFRINPTTTGTATLYSHVGLFEFEPRAALAFYTRPNQTGLFARPRIGAGLLIDSYSIDHLTQSLLSTNFQTLYHTGAAFEVRPAIQVGYSWGPGEVGVEGSYMIAWGDFGEFGSEAQEYRIGPFFTYKF